jgi:peptidoglycan hydrolase-like amidase
MEYYEHGGGATAKLAINMKATSTTATPNATSNPTVVNPTPFAGEPLMRVGITSVAKGTAVKVISPNQLQVQSDGVPLTTVSGNQEASVTYSGSTYSVQAGSFSKTSSKPIRFIPKDQGIITVTSYSAPNWRFGTASYHPDKDNYNKFRGTIEVVYASGSATVWVVNELPLEQYVWGSGEPTNTLPAEYLRAFSMLFRSYAKAYLEKGGKRSGEPYILVNTSADQIYEGYNRELYTGNYVTAAKGTAGNVLTYNDKTIITPYFSKSKGETTLSATEVWGRSDLPWCQAVTDPYGANEGTPDCFGNGCPNHGVGLSAAGARGYISKENKTAEWVLNHYYTGIEIKDLW